MPPTHQPLPMQHSIRSYAPLTPIQTQQFPPDDSASVVFTRHLWQRSMPDDNDAEHGVLHESRTANSQASQRNSAPPARAASSKPILHSDPQPASSSGESTPPLKPEESPAFRTTRRRSADIVGLEDNVFDNSDTSSAHTRASSGESVVQVCICQPEPKPPRPRNVFILYRQHHQASVVSQNPGLANPEISKIIGQQWQNEPEQVKGEWRALAEKEKLHHQQLYPHYRYQPKRSTRRGSVDAASLGERPRCHKCGGRTILTPSTPFPGAFTASLPPTPRSAFSPANKASEVFRDMSLESPTARRSSSRVRPSSIMPPKHRGSAEERDDSGPLSGESKRRRYDVDQPSPPQPTLLYHVAQTGPAIPPGSPFPVGYPHHTARMPYSDVAYQVKREALPGIGGMISPHGHMAPPPPPMGYARHRASQGHDRSLTLPPLQTARSESASTVPPSAPPPSKTVKEEIDGISFQYKIDILSQVAPPAPRLTNKARGPLIAIEGDDPKTVHNVYKWLHEDLAKKDNLAVNLLAGPEIPDARGEENPMALYHHIASQWLIKNKSIVESLAIEIPATPPAYTPGMTNLSWKTNSTDLSAKIDDKYDGEDDKASPTGSHGGDAETTQLNKRSGSSVTSVDRMETDVKEKRPSTAPSSLSRNIGLPVTIVPNFNVYACNSFSHLIPIGDTETYNPCDHWQWMATLWRGITGPDVTIYIQDYVPSPNSKSQEHSIDSRRMDLEELEKDTLVPSKLALQTRLVTVRKNVMKNVGGEELDVGGIEGGVLRRLGFEVSEWIRKFCKEGLDKQKKGTE